MALLTCVLYISRDHLLLVQGSPRYLGEGKIPDLYCIASSVISSSRMLFPDAHSLLLQEASLFSRALCSPAL